MADLSVAQRSGDPSRRSPGLLRRVSGWLLAVVAVLAGLLAALVALFLTASISESRVLSLAAGALAGVGVAGGLGRLSVRVRKGPRARRRLLVAATCAALALALVAGMVWGVFLAPVPYDPYTAAGPTSYWRLPTGSDIAYTRTATRVTRAEPVVLVHGGPGAPDEGFEPLAASLATAGFAVYTYQQLGAGQSGRLSDVRGYTVGRQVADLEAIRNQLGADKMILVGNSWGGTLTANYLAAHPTHVAKAVVASPGPIWYPGYPGNSDMTTGGAENQNATLMRHKRFPISVYLASIVGPRALHTILPERVADGLYQGFARDLSMSAGCTPPPADLVETESRQHPRGQAFWVDVMTTIDGHKIADPRPALRGNTTPVLVMRAQCDFLAWPVTREYRDLLPNATMVTIADAGHTIVRDQPGPYEDNIVSFLSGEPLPLKPYTGEPAPW